MGSSSSSDDEEAEAEAVADRGERQRQTRARSVCPLALPGPLRWSTVLHPHRASHPRLALIFPCALCEQKPTPGITATPRADNPRHFDILIEGPKVTRAARPQRAVGLAWEGAQAACS